MDIQYSKNGGDVIYLTSSDGVGELFVLDKNNKVKKVSQDLNIRGTVGYGGGDFDASENFFVVCDKSGNIFAIESKKEQCIKQITPNYLKTASPKISPDENWSLFVYDQNEISGIGIALINGLNWPRQLVLGSDFYMHPAWHPNGEIIAWTEWDHPFMPWDASRIKIGYVSGMQLRLTEELFIDGQFDASANQPQFSPDGKWLSYIKRSGNWDDLILYEINTHKKKVIVKGEGFHLRLPDWVQGHHSYQWSGDSTTLFFIRYHHGTSSISKVNIKTSRMGVIDISPYTWISQISASKISDKIAFIASSQMESDQIVRYTEGKSFPFNINTKKQQSHASEGQEIAFQTKENSIAYAWFYPPICLPKNGEKPPCILNIHSGPTSVKHLGYSLETEIFTSQGYAIVYLNYRGSVTYGYDYQNALQRKWGEIEVQDAVSLINDLISHDVVDPHKLAVMGSSAGGFSVLNVLINNPGLFQAGICSYPVSDLVDDAKNTHKFEKYYHRFLTGEFPGEYEKFIAHSPITHLDKIKDPLALFHGSEDKVVSPDQTQKIFDSISLRGIPCVLKVYESEGHGFRKQETIENYFNTIFTFLNTHLKY